MPKAATKDDHAERVLQAAASLFRAHGFATATVRDIAAKADILPGSLHYRFPTKESLLIALMEHAVDQTTAAVRSAVSASHDPIERLRLGLRAHLRMLLSGDDAIYVLLYEWRALGGRAREEMVRLRDRYESFWDGLLYEAAGAGRIRDGLDLKLLRLLGFGAINWVAQWYSPSGERTPDEIADAFWAFIGFGVVADESRPADIGDIFRSLSALEVVNG